MIFTSGYDMLEVRLRAWLTTTTFKLFLQKIHVEFELQGIEADKLNSQHWQSIEQRMTTEEAACQLAGADNEENG